jgi:hypothetical protein
MVAVSFVRHSSQRNGLCAKSAEVLKVSRSPGVQRTYVSRSNLHDSQIETRKLQGKVSRSAGSRNRFGAEHAVQTVIANNYSLYIKGKAEAKPALILTDPQASSEPAKHTVLIFHRMGNTYFLYQVWVAGSEVGREFPRSQTETQMAMNGTKPEKVSVAANVIH